MRQIAAVLVTIVAVAIIAALGALALGHWIEDYFQERVYDYAQPSILIGGQTVAVAVADTDLSRAQGLSGRPGLGPNEGMLFVFPNDGYWAFWMKDMKFSIDMVWLDDAGDVIYLKKNVAPSTYPTAFQPDTPARYVIELPAGFADAHNVRVGDQVTLPKVLE